MKFDFYTLIHFVCWFTERMFHSSCEGLIKQPLEKLKKGLAIRFQGEEGMVSRWLGGRGEILNVDIDVHASV